MKTLLDNKCYADAKRAFDYIDQRLFCKEEGTVIRQSLLAYHTQNPAYTGTIW